MADTRLRDSPPLPENRSSGVLFGQLRAATAGINDDIPRRAGPAPVQPLVEAAARIGAQDAVRLELQDPLDPREEFVVEANVGHEAVHALLVLDLPGLRQDHEVELTDDLLVLDGVASTHADDALFRTDEEEPPIGWDDGGHVQKLRH